jgi:hypothetical protein
VKVLLALFYSLSLFAGETDQYMAAGAVIRDSSDVINNYYNLTIDQTLEAAQRTGFEYNCYQITDKILNNITKNLSRLSSRSPEIERYPDDSISSKEYLQASIYKNAGFPFMFTKLRRTINLGGIYVGTDKMGHFGLISRNYYKHYSIFRKNGLRDDLAIQKTIIRGIHQELNILGYHYNGVFSFADMEANYQGLIFAISICQSNNPYLVHVNKEWKKNPVRAFDIRQYITPKMDESFNPSFRRRSLWKKIKPTVREIYCPLKTNELYQERLETYKTKDTTTINDLYIQKYFSTKPKFTRSLESMDDVCP